MTNQNGVSLAQAVSSRSRLTETAPACGKTLHIGFFFDGFSRHPEIFTDSAWMSLKKRGGGTPTGEH